MDKRSLAQVLLDLRLISVAKLEEIRNLQKTRPTSCLEALLLESKLVTEEELLKAQEVVYGMAALDLRAVQLDQRLSSVIPEKLARRHLLLPLHDGEDGLHIAIGNPRNILALDELRMLTGKMVTPHFAAPTQILDIIEQYYRPSNHSAQQVVQLIEAETGLRGDEPVQEAVELDQAPVIRLLDHIINEALQSRASDIHIEPGRAELIVRYRIDGVLFIVHKFPPKVHPPLISRLKIMANLDITQHFTPQDGSISYYHTQNLHDLRLSIMPTIYGEKAVIRILQQYSQLFSLEEIGFAREDLWQFNNLLKSSHGMILVTGPTGSGKSTTLSSSIKTLISPTINISTVEDPVEYKIDQVNQTQVNEKTGMTFARALRSLLRQDPDVLMIGEIRDEETANIAIRAALTGHLVLSSLHTNDAVSTISRLQNMDIPNYLIASSLIGVVAQRLVRRICPDCREERELALEEERLLQYRGQIVPERVFRGQGCPKCHGTGYYGRVGIFEIIIIDEEMREHIINHSPLSTLYQCQKARGQSLWNDALKKVQEGLTTPGEILRVIS